MGGLVLRRKGVAKMPCKDCSTIHEWFYDCFMRPNNCCSHGVIRKAVTQLIKNDRYLLEKQVNERSQTHKLAEYLQDALPEWNVDCEYDKNLNNPKKLDFNGIVEGVNKIIGENALEDLLGDLPEVESKNKLGAVLRRLQSLLKTERIFSSEGNLDGLSFLMFTTEDGRDYIKRVFPDIIAHVRGTENNRIVVEAKKEANENTEARWFDLIKLLLFTQSKGGVQFGYQAGYFIDLPTNIPNRFSISFSKDPLIQKIDEKLDLDSNVWIVKIT